MGAGTKPKTDFRLLPYFSIPILCKMYYNKITGFMHMRKNDVAKGIGVKKVRETGRREGMKLRLKMLLLVIMPLLCLGGITYVVGSKSITEAMTDRIALGLQATAVATREAISVGMAGEFRVDENGDLWKGDMLNISQSVEIADDVKNATGMEVTVFFGDTRYMTSVKNEAGERVTGTKASTEVAQAVLQRGENYFAENVDVAGEKFFAFYVPMYNGSSNVPVGMVFTGMSQREAEAVINAIVWNLLLIILVTVVVIMVVAWVVANNLAKGIKTGVAAVEELSKGNLKAEMNKKYMARKDEIGELASSVDKLKSQMVSLIGHIAEKSEMVYEESQMLAKKAAHTASMVTQVEKAVEEIATGATYQAEETQNATENIVVMGTMVEDTNGEVGTLAENSNQIREASDSAMKILKELGEINRNVMSAMEMIYRQTNTTNESAIKIREATNFITSIAEETNLLSLNASIEAARAGEQGRGFAVVAGQIQKLAEQSDESAKQIEAITNSLIRDAEEAVGTMNGMQEIMERQTKTVNESEETFGRVKEGIDQSIASIQAIAQQTSRLDAARAKVIGGVQNLSAVAQENAASTEETSASAAEVSAIMGDISKSAEQLEDIADELKKNIGLFRL